MGLEMAFDGRVYENMNSACLFCYDILFDAFCFCFCFCSILFFSALNFVVYIVVYNFFVGRQFSTRARNSKITSSATGLYVSP